MRIVHCYLISMIVFILGMVFVFIHAVVVVDYQGAMFALEYTSYSLISLIPALAVLRHQENRRIKSMQRTL